MKILLPVTLKLPSCCGSAREEWHWTIRLSAQPDELIGSISLMDAVDNNRGFWLAPQWQGQGLMSEACEVVDAYWFQTLRRACMRVPKEIGRAHV